MLLSGPKKKHREETMSHLFDTLKAFNARQASEETIQGMLFDIAKVVLSGGYFEVNGDTTIYPMDIEFYLYDEKDPSRKWMRDANMYHKGPKVRYFPVIGTFYPHESGVDVTFENPDEGYRASFLIRAYKYEENGEIVRTPRYLWEDLFGYGSFFGDGLHIKWIDSPDDAKVDIKPDYRHHLNDENQQPDKKKWRFYRV